MTDYELINITLDEIRRSSTVIEIVSHESAIRSIYSPEKEVYDGMYSRGKIALGCIRQKLKDVLEEISEYRNSEGMIDEDEIEFTKGAYNLIYKNNKS